MLPLSFLSISCILFQIVVVARWVFVEDKYGLRRLDFLFIVLQN